ncbi:MAG: hypothetical protein JW918_04905 [Anaerolineae bacterium]|nr:hypothetical protein [Anaerolineae bacterium]
MGAVEALSGPDRAFIDQIEQRARQVGAMLQALPAGDQARADLSVVIATLVDLYARLAEWAELHRLIHDLLAALAPFHALLASADGSALDAEGRQALLQDWRYCQRCVDKLADFAEEVASIGRPFRRKGRELEGERWVVDVVALRMLVEDALKEDDPGLGLIELVEELDGACHRHLAVADRELTAVVDRTRRLLTILQGGLE